MTTLFATPTTIVATAKAAKPGDTIKLTPGVYPPFAVKAVKADPPIIIEGGPGATLTGVSLGMACEGITFRGASFVMLSGTKAPLPVGLTIGDDAKRIVVEDCDFSAAGGFLANGIWVRKAFDVKI